VKVSIPKEILADEHRVAATPKTVAKMVKAGISVVVESGAGLESCITDEEFHQAGAEIAVNVESLLNEADVVLKVQPPGLNESTGTHELDMFQKGATLIGVLQPLINHDLVTKLAERRITAFSLDCLPRIARAQAMDVLSSMSTLAGYKSVLLAANALRSVLPMLTTAAGTLYPAQTLIIGAGVAGLQAVATAKRLGSVVKVFDVRPVVKEQVESLGAEFIDMDVDQQQAEDAGGYAKEQSVDVQQKAHELIGQHIKQADIVITTALIPGKKAPILINEEMVQTMKIGSVIVDLAAEQGGNCELSEPGKQIIQHGVTLIGLVNLPSSLAVHGSLMYANNLANFLLHVYDDQQIAVNLEDEITRQTIITHQGEVLHSGVQEVLGLGKTAETS